MVTSARCRFAVGACLIRYRPRPLLIALLVSALLSMGGCEKETLEGTVSGIPSNWGFVGDRAPCYLEVNSASPHAFRVNCFEIDGRLHVHSHRFAKVARPFGESWVTTVRRDDRVRISLSRKIYRLRAMPIDDPEMRHAILISRGYDSPPEGIVVFELTARDQHQE